jgi:hypothetical protein
MFGIIIIIIIIIIIATLRKTISRKENLMLKYWSSVSVGKLYIIILNG